MTKNDVCPLEIVEIDVGFLVPLIKITSFIWFLHFRSSEIFFFGKVFPF